MVRKPRAGTEVSKQRILDAAAQLAIERGYDRTTMAAVSERSGLPIGSVYWHFDSKDRLFAALIEYSFARWRDTHFRARSVQEVFSEGIALGIARSLDIADDSQGFWRIGLILALERYLEGSESRSAYLAARREGVELLERQFAQTLPDDLRATHPALTMELATLTLALSDGMFVALSVDEMLDLSRYADLATMAVEGVIRRYIG